MLLVASRRGCCQCALRSKCLLLLRCGMAVDYVCALLLLGNLQLRLHHDLLLLLLLVLLLLLQQQLLLLLLLQQFGCGLQAVQLGNGCLGIFGLHKVIAIGKGVRIANSCLRGCNIHLLLLLLLWLLL